MKPKFCQFCWSFHRANFCFINIYGIYVLYFCTPLYVLPSTCFLFPIPYAGKSYYWFDNVFIYIGILDYKFYSEQLFLSYNSWHNFTLLISMYFLFSLMISSWIYWLLRIVLFNFHVFANFPSSSWCWFWISFHCGGKICNPFKYYKSLLYSLAYSIIQRINHVCLRIMCSLLLG